MLPQPPPTSIFDPYFAPLHVAFLFILGASFGSFFNVCIYRIPRGVPLSLPPSHCYCCGSRVRWYDNLPLISWWVLGGRCRTCGAEFSLRYWAIELLTALLFIGAGATLGYTLALIPALIFISLLIVATFTDIDHWIIPDRISLGGLVIGLVLAAIPPIGNAPKNPLAIALIDAGPMFSPLANAIVGAAVGFGGLWAIGVIGSLMFRKDAMGFGDVKLFGMFGAFCGLAPLLYLLLISCVIGTLVGLVGIVRGRLANGAPDPAIAPLKLDEAAIGELLTNERLTASEREAVAAAMRKPGVVGTARHHLPFGPSLAAAAVLVYLFQQTISSTLDGWIMKLSHLIM